MCVFDGNWFWCDVLISLGLFVTVTYWFLTRHFNYWKNRNVPYIEPTVFFGSLKEVVLKRTSWKLLFEKWYTEFKHCGFGGAYFLTKPFFFVCHKKLIEKILVEDFNYFRDRVPEYNKKIALSNTLTHSTGLKWRELHLKIAPTFSSLKVRGMMQQIIDCTSDVMIQINSSIEKNEPLQVENISFLYTSETIGRCTFGVKLFSDTDECKAFQSVFNLIYKTNFFNLILNTISAFYPRIINLLNIDLLPTKVSNLIFHLTKSIIGHRKNSKTKRNDFLQTLLDLKEQEDIQCDGTNLKKEKLFTDQSISALMFSFLLAGLKSTSTTLSFALFEIARNHLIQEKLHSEIDTMFTKYSGLTFDSIKEMTYLDQVIQETLRLHCFNLSLFRKVKKNYRVPGTGLVLEKDMYVFIPITAIHMDPEYYPNPEIFNPDRFGGANYNPTSTFLPFGLGPRACIAIKFAKLIVKTYVAKILSECKINISTKMIVPMEYEKNEFYPKAKGGIWLDFFRKKHK